MRVNPVDLPDPTQAHLTRRSFPSVGRHRVIIFQPVLFRERRLWGLQSERVENRVKVIRRCRIAAAERGRCGSAWATCCARTRPPWPPSASRCPRARSPWLLIATGQSLSPPRPRTRCAASRHVQHTGFTAPVRLTQLALVRPAQDVLCTLHICVRCSCPGSPPRMLTHPAVPFVLCSLGSRASRVCHVPLSMLTHPVFCPLQAAAERQMGAPLWMTGLLCSRASASCSECVHWRGGAHMRAACRLSD